MRKTVVLDLDGTVYLGDHPVKPAIHAIYALRDHGYSVLYATNNSTKTRHQISDKLLKMGIENNPNDIYTSLYTTVNYLMKKKIYDIVLVGSAEFENILQHYGIHMVPPKDAEAVVVGLDISCDYTQIAQAAEALLSGAQFIACNLDANYPAENQRLLPGCNTMVSALTGATQIKPHHIIGKPSTYILEDIAHDYQLGADDIWVIGDSIESDIRMAEAYGCSSILIDQTELSWHKALQTITGGIQ